MKKQDLASVKTKETQPPLELRRKSGFFYACEARGDFFVN